MDKIGGNLDIGTIGSKPFKTIIDQMSLIDCFRYLYPTKRAVTCLKKNVFGGTSNYEIVGSRLDRFYTSAIFKRDIKSFDTVPCVCSDHDFIILTLSGKNETGITYGKSYWKFNDELLNDCNFVTSFEIFWKIVSRTETIDLQWWDRMKENIKTFCIDFSKSKNRKLYGELKSLKTRYNSLNLNDESNLKQLNEIKTRVKEIETSFIKGSIVRSKVHDLDTNENPTSYFFQKEASLSKSKTIKSISLDNHTYKTSPEILTCFQHFYEDLYKEEPVDSSLNHHFLDNLPKIEENDNLLVSKYIEKGEILQALKAMKPNTSPGNDGLTNAFYLKFFHLLGDVLCKVINLAYETGELSESQKLSYITLICKDKTRADNMKCYRPISLLNVDYKIISKVLSSRLSNVLPNIIGLDQTCSVKGRSIFDNLHLLRNVIDYIEQKDIGACFISLDQEKAFDRVSWSFLLDTLTAFGFDNAFLKWVKLTFPLRLLLTIIFPIRFQFDVEYDKAVHYPHFSILSVMNLLQIRLET